MEVDSKYRSKNMWKDHHFLVSLTPHPFPILCRLKKTVFLPSTQRLEWKASEGAIMDYKLIMAF